MTRRGQLPLTALAVAILLGACSGSTDAPRDMVREEFAARETFAECDAVTVEPGAPLQLPEESLECLRAPLDGTSPNAELRVDVLTTEGDPIAHYFRTSSSTSRVELFIDPSEDEFSAPADRLWQHCEQNFPPSLEVGCS